MPPVVLASPVGVTFGAAVGCSVARVVGSLVTVGDGVGGGSSPGFRG